MKKFLVITIDVEPDCSPNWHYSDPLRFDGVSKGIGKLLQPLFNEYGFVPTYLINNVVLEDQRSVDVLRQLSGKFELGTHLHPEFITPQKKYDNYAGKKAVANCCFYPPEIEYEKIKNVSQLFENNFGYKPLSFRAGRYSAGSNTIKSLARLGYRVDTSVTPHISWSDKTRERPVDCLDAPEQPYLIDEENITKENINGNLLQVPISISLKNRNFFKEILVSGGGLRHRIRKHKAFWLRPYYSTTPQLISIGKQFLSAYQDREAVVLNMMFHNVEVLPGLSPYTISENDCKKYLNQLRDFFGFCRQENIQGTALSDLYNVFKK